MKRIMVWDPLVRVFHWGLAAGFVALALVIEDESALHIQLGYVLMALIGLRVLWGLIGSRHARFADFPPRIGAAMEQLRHIATLRSHAHVGHSPLGALMIYNLLISILLIGVTGWLMGTNAFWGSEALEELHEGLVVWAGLSAMIHVAAVLFESRRTGINLPRSMVTGYKSVPDSSET